MRQFCVNRLPAAAALLIGLCVPAHAMQRTMTIVNETDVAIAAFYAANVNKSDWQDNRLDQALPAGSSVAVDLDDGSGYCLFNFRAVFADGDEIVSKRVNVCDEDAFYYRP